MGTIREQLATARDELSVLQQRIMSLEAQIATSATLKVRCEGDKRRELTINGLKYTTDEEGFLTVDGLAPDVEYDLKLINITPGWVQREDARVIPKAGQETSVLLRTKRLTTPTPSGPRKIVLAKPWDGRVIHEEDLEIDCNGLELIKQRDHNGNIYGGRTITIRNCVIYNFTRLYEAATFDTTINLYNVICPDLWEMNGRHFRGVLDDIDRMDDRFNGTPAEYREARLIQPAGLRYGVYVEAKSIKGKPIQGAESVKVNFDGWRCGSMQIEHCLRAELGVSISGRNFALWNWANTPKGDKVNGGSSMRLHCQSVDLRVGSAGFYTKFGHALNPMQALTMTDVRLRGGCNWEGPPIPQRQLSNVTLNGARLE